MYTSPPISRACVYFASFLLSLVVETTRSQKSIKVSICIGMRPISFRYYLFLERLLIVVNENNGNPTCSLLGSELVRREEVINLIGHYMVGPLFLI